MSRSIGRFAVRAVRRFVLLAAISAAGLLVWRGLSPFLGPEDVTPALPGGSFFVQRGSMDVSYAYKGTVKAKKSEKIKPKFRSSAKITWLIDEGARVAKDEVLARFDETAFQKRLADIERSIKQTESSMSAAAAELEILKGTGPADAEKARLAVKMAEMDLESLKLGELPDTERKNSVALESAVLDRDTAKRKLGCIPEMVERGFVSQDRLREEEMALKRREMEVDEASCNLDMFRKYTSRSMLHQKEAALAEAESGFRTVEKRSETKVKGLEAQILQLKATLGQFRKQQLETREEISKLTLTAPSGGVVVYGDEDRPWARNNVKLGQQVSQWNVLFTLPDMSELIVKYKVPEGDIANLKQGMEAFVDMDAAGLRGKRARISKLPEVTLSEGWRADPNLKEFEVEAEIDEKNLPVKPGISASVSIRSATVENVIKVPVHALRGEKRELFVYVLRHTEAGGVLERSRVEVGLRGAQFGEVKSGLAVGDLVFLGEPPAELLRIEETMKDLGLRDDGAKKQAGGRTIDSGGMKIDFTSAGGGDGD